MCYVNWKGCERIFSRQIWCNIFLRQMCKNAVMIQYEGYLDWNRCGIKLSCPTLKCYVDWKVWDRKISRQICNSMLIRWDDKGWCHDLICGDILIGTDDNGCCYDQI
jgi:hypothetical protein